MSQILYRVINPIVKAILRSPVHGLLSKNTILLEFKGRKTGRELCTPVSYSDQNGQLHCFTSQDFGWWRNLVGENSEVRVRLRGRSIIGKVNVVVDEPDVVATALTAFLIAVPRDAPHAGVRWDENQVPNAADIANSAKKMVYLSIELAETQP